MEIEITRFFNEAEHAEISASRSELGDNAGEITWRNANKSETLDFLPSFNPEGIQAIKDWFGDFGAWSDEERQKWSDSETRALLAQFIAGDIREAESLCWSDELEGIDWEKYEKEGKEGRVSSRMYCTLAGAEHFQGQVFFYIGN